MTERPWVTKFTIDADSELARELRKRQGATDVTLTVTAHDKTFTRVERLTTARLTGWTIRSSCDHRGCTRCPSVMDVEWLDADAFVKASTLPEMPELGTPARHLQMNYTKG